MFSRPNTSTNDGTLVTSRAIMCSPVQDRGSAFQFLCGELQSDASTPQCPVLLKHLQQFNAHNPALNTIQIIHMANCGLLEVLSVADVSTDDGIFDELYTVWNHLIEAYKRHYYQLGSVEGILVGSLEFFVYSNCGYSSSRYRQKLASVVKQVLDIYIDHPELVAGWLKMREAERRGRNNSSFCPVTPSIQFALTYHVHMATEASADLMCDARRVCGISEVIENEVKASSILNQLLDYPYSLLRMKSSFPRYQRSSSGAIELCPFQDDESMAIYATALMKYLEFSMMVTASIRRCMYQKLFEFFKQVLQVYNALDGDPGYSSLFFDGIIIACVEGESELIFGHIASIFDEPLFANLIWSCLFCFKETREPLEAAGTLFRVTHMQVINFLDFIFLKADQHFRRLVYFEVGEDCKIGEADADVAARSDTVAPVSSNWPLSVIGNTMNENLVDVTSEKLVGILRSYSSPSTATLDLIPGTIFLHILQARINAFRFFTPLENDAFFHLLLGVCSMTRFCPVQRDSSPISQAVINASTNDLSWETVGFPLSTVPSLNAMKLEWNNWLFYWHHTKVHEMKKYASDNDGLLKWFLSDVYCFNKFFTVRKGQLPNLEIGAGVLRGLQTYASH